MDARWNNYKIDYFEFEERDALIVYPNVTPNGKIVVKTEYFDDFPDFEFEMLDKGYYLCNISHSTRWATDEETDIMARFIKYTANKLNASEKCILVGMSCGGLQAAKLTQKYPELTAVMYLDAPVLNILSMAGLGDRKESISWRELVNAYGFSRSTVVNFRESPIDDMDVLIKNNIPIIMLYGDADDVVIYEENGKVLEDYYKKHGGTIKVIRKSMCSHHPHGLKNNKIIIDFVEKYV